MLTFCIHCQKVVLPCDEAKLPFNNNAILVGCIVGLFAGAILMAVVGEIVNPHRPPEPQGSELD